MSDSPLACGPDTLPIARGTFVGFRGGSGPAGDPQTTEPEFVWSYECPGDAGLVTDQDAPRVPGGVVRG